MSTGDLIDDDADVSAAVGKILARGPEALGDAPEREDVRENRTDREPHEQAEDADLDEQRAERDEPEAKAEEASEEQFLEIPGDTEDAEPVKIPLSEAAEAVKQIRQMDGDIAAAVIRAETEAQAKQDEITSALAKQYHDLAVAAQATARVMQQYLPQPPDPNLRYTDPQAYYDQQLYYEEYATHISRVTATIAQADTGRTATLTQQEKALIDREQARTARYIPEFGDETKREAKKAEITDALAKRYGITKADMDETFDHRFWRMARDLAGYVAAEAKAPEVKKAVQEKAAKLTNGKLPPREQGSGRFVSESRKALRETGSVDAAAALFMKSGLTRNL